VKPRVTILNLMAVIALTATGIVALRSPREVWASAYLSITLLLLSTAVPGMAFGRGERRGFWVGVSAFGWPYLVLGFGPVPGTSVKPPPLLTTTFLEYLQPHVTDAPPAPEFISGEGTQEGSQTIRITAMMTAGKVTFFRNATEYFLRTGHALFGLILCVAGGLVGSHFAARRGVSAREAGP
jgi:hypothetical protein